MYVHKSTLEIGCRYYLNCLDLRDLKSGGPRTLKKMNAANCIFIIIKIFILLKTETLAAESRKLPPYIKTLLRKRKRLILQYFKSIYNCPIRI